MTGFAPVAELKVSGLTGYYREPGSGHRWRRRSPLPDEEGQPKDLLAPELTIPVTALFRLPRSRSGSPGSR